MAAVQALPSLDELSHSVRSVAALGKSPDGAERAALLSSLHKLAATLETPEDAVNRAIFFPATFMCARVAIDLNLFNIIAEANGPITAAGLAAKSKADEQLIVRLLRGLTLSGLVGEAGDQIYEANPVTRHLTIRPVQAGLIHFYDAGLKSLYFMPEYFRTNGYKCPEDPKAGPLQFAFGTTLESYSFWQTQPAFARNFNTFMAGKLTSSKTGQSWNDWYPVKERIIDRFDEVKGDTLFVDIAGGRGHEVSQLRASFPDAPGRFVLEDLPAVIGDIHELDSNIERIPYDFFTAQPVMHANVYFLANIFHNWSDKDSSIILANTVAAMKPGYSKLLISDHILPEQNCPFHSFGRDIAMMSLHGGVERSEKQWKALLESAGLEIDKFFYGVNGEGLVEATLIEERLRP